MIEKTTGDTKGTDRTSEIAAPTQPVAADATVPLPATRPTLSGSQLSLVFICAALASFLIGIGIGVATREPLDDVVVASKRISSAGGTVRFDGGQVRIPEGALDRSIQIVVRRSTFDDRIRVERAGEDRSYGPRELMTYRFEPADLTFRKAVEITFRLEPGSRNAALFARRDNAIVLLSGLLDPDRRTATMTVRDFRFAGDAP